MTDRLFESDRCCSPEAVYRIRSNQSVGVVAFAPIRQTDIARPKMGGVCSDFWNSRHQLIQALISETQASLIETAWHSTSMYKYQQPA
jgi:hypothetical protein